MRTLVVAIPRLEGKCTEKHQKVDGTPPGEELKKTTYSMEELGQRLGLKEATAYELVAKGHFDVVDVLGKRRVTKESFERWYASQTDYRTVEDQELDADSGGSAGK